MTKPWNMARVRSQQLPRKPYKPVAPVVCTMAMPSIDRVSCSCHGVSVCPVPAVPRQYCCSLAFQACPQCPGTAASHHTHCPRNELMCRECLAPKTQHGVGCRTGLEAREYRNCGCRGREHDQMCPTRKRTTIDNPHYRGRG